MYLTRAGHGASLGALVANETSGHLCGFYNSNTNRDNRTSGAESRLTGRHIPARGRAVLCWMCDPASGTARPAQAGVETYVRF